MTPARFNLDRLRHPDGDLSRVRDWLYAHRRWVPAVALVVAAAIATAAATVRMSATRRVPPPGWISGGFRNA